MTAMLLSVFHLQVKQVRRHPVIFLFVLVIAALSLGEAEKFRKCFLQPSIFYIIIEC